MSTKRRRVVNPELQYEFRAGHLLSIGELDIGLRPAWSVDRSGRSQTDLLSILQQTRR